MKFVCDKCNTRYSIADERVHGRVLKIRCKACNNVITVREDHPLPAPPPPVASSLEDALSNFSRDDEQTRVSTMPPAAEPGAGDEWFVSFDGEQEGPLPLARALDRVRAERPRGKECFCWRGGFFVWLPIEDVPEFAPALVKLPPPIPAVRPRPATGAQAVVRSPTGQQQAVRSPTGQQQAVRSPSGQHAAIKSPTGQQPALKSPTGQQPALRGPSGNMNAVRAPSDLPAMDSGPLGTPGALLPSLETKPEPRLMRQTDAAPSPLVPTSLPDSGPSTLSPFAAALQVSGPTQVAGDAPRHAAAPEVRPPTLDSGPVPLPPPPGEDLPIDEPSGLVNLSHVSKPALSHPMNQAKQVVETFGGHAVTPSKPTPPPQPIIVSPGRAGAPGWLKWAALAGASATVALLIVVVVLMGRKPTVIVVPPAPAIDDGKKVADKPITIVDPDSPTKQHAGDAQPAVAGTPADAKRSQKRPPSSARAGTMPKPPAENLSSSQRNLASLYRDEGNEHGATRAAGTADNGRGGSTQVSQQAIMSVVTQNRRSLNLCYDRVLKHDSSLKSGRVVTHVRIGISGSVTGVSVPDPQYANSEIGQCIAQTIKHWHFPSADAEYETEFPIILQAN
ncbi:MAG: family finger-like protein [bacterium]|nr:family finger-like protein [bacterium]